MMSFLPPPSLKDQQSALLRAVLACPSDAHGAQQASQALHGLIVQHVADNAPFTRGLKVYRANGHAMAESSLQTAYPVIRQMLGGASFDALARSLWHRHPPQLGDLARWGDALPGALEQDAQLAAFPYLGDVSRAEWALHRAQSAADIEPDPASFALLASNDLADLTVVLAPGTEVLDSLYPIASLIIAHLQSEPDLSKAAKLLQAKTAECAVIWRHGLRPRIEPCHPVGAALLRALQLGHDMDTAINMATTSAAKQDPPGQQGHASPWAQEVVPRETSFSQVAADVPSAVQAPSAFDFSQWLTEAVTKGWIIGVKLNNRPKESLPCAQAGRGVKR